MQRDLSPECTKVLHDGKLLPMLMYGNKTRVECDIYIEGVMFRWIILGDGTLNVNLI